MLTLSYHFAYMPKPESLSKTLRGLLIYLQGFAVCCPALLSFE